VRCKTWVNAGTWGLLIVATAVAFGQAFAQMWLRWFPAWNNPNTGIYDRLVEGESYYTHGPLVPLVSGLIALLLIRHTKIEIRPCPRWGWPAVIVSLGLHLLGSLARVHFVSELAFIALVASLVLLLWGAAALRRLWFAIAFLLFMVPLPEVTIASLNFRLKMIAADWGVCIASLLGIAVERDGPAVVLAGGKMLVVANVCNGLRTLISLLAFGALYTYICRLRGLWRAVLFLLAVPMAVVCNAIRIASLIVVAEVWDEKAATGWWHDTSGVLIFVLAFWLMFLMERLIMAAIRLAGRPAAVTPLFANVRRSQNDAPPWPAMARLASGRPAALAVAAIAIAAVGAWWLNQPGRSSASDQTLEAAIPSVLTVEGRSWTGEPRTLTQRELTILEGPAYLYRRYRADGTGEMLDYCFLYSKDNRKGIHPPDLCVEGFGQGIIQKGDLVADGVPGREGVPCSELIVHDGTNRIYILYTYKCGEAYTRSFWRQQMKIFVNGLTHRQGGGGMIRISLQIDSDIPAARQRAVEFLRATIPGLDEHLGQ